MPARPLVRSGPCRPSVQGFGCRAVPPCAFQSRMSEECAPSPSRGRATRETITERLQPAPAPPRDRVEELPMLLRPNESGVAKKIRHAASVENRESQQRRDLEDFERPLLPEQVEVVEAVAALRVLDTDHGRVAVPRGRLLYHRDISATRVLDDGHVRVAARRVHVAAI